MLIVGERSLPFRGGVGSDAANLSWLRATQTAREGGLRARHCHAGLGRGPLTALWHQGKLSLQWQSRRAS